MKCESLILKKVLVPSNATAHALQTFHHQNKWMYIFGIISKYGKLHYFPLYTPT